MGEVVAFPGEQEREWKAWEETIQANPGAGVSNEVIEECLPAVKAHWQVIFQSVSLDIENGEVPVPPSMAQAGAIQGLIASSAKVAIYRLKHERAQSLRRLITLEVLLARTKRGEV